MILNDTAPILSSLARTKGRFVPAVRPSPLVSPVIPDQALTRGSEALTLAQQLSHPASLAYVRYWLAFSIINSGAQKTQQWTNTSIALSTEQGFGYWPPQEMILQGWVLTEEGRVKEGIARLRQGSLGLQAAGTEITRAYWLGLLANGYKERAARGGNW